MTDKIKQYLLVDGCSVYLKKQVHRKLHMWPAIIMSFETGLLFVLHIMENIKVASRCASMSKYINK